jgi:hypothetical protein
MLDGGELLLLWVFSVSLHDKVDMHSRIYYNQTYYAQITKYFLS